MTHRFSKNNTHVLLTEKNACIVTKDKMIKIPREDFDSLVEMINEHNEWNSWEYYPTSFDSSSDPRFG